MTTTLKIRDEELTGKAVSEFSLDFLTEHIDVRELIRSRIYQEVMDHNAKENQAEFNGLIQPSDAERTLNGYRLKKPRKIDWHKQFESALEAFEQKQILILVNDRQVESLDDSIEVATDKFNLIP